MEIIMKKLIAAAVATSVSAIAVADVSITGNAKYEYFNSQTGSAASTNTANTEVNLGIVGKTGDTTVVMNLEFNTHGDVNGDPSVTTTTTTSSETVDDGGSMISTSTSTSTVSDTNRLDIEDLYMQTKVGDVTVKAGNYASGTSALLGEIDNGGRVTNKVTLSMPVGGATVYVGNDGTAGAGSTALNQNMFAGVSMDIGGQTVQLKQNSPTVDSYGIKGSVAGINYRYEHKDNDVANSDVDFIEVGTEVNGIKLSYAAIDADQAGLVTEDDSSIFAVEMGSGGAAKAYTDGVSQFTAAGSFEGNSVTFKVGTLDKALTSGTVDQDYYQIGVSRPLASGATATVMYTDKDASASTSTETLEVELSVKF
jgi:hypothetical protein